MRVIKFRGKRIDDPNQWEYGYVLVDDTDVWIHTLDGRVLRVIPETVGQFTGLHDKNGKEIYEGDIVQCGRFIYRVQYDADRIASFYISRDGDFYNHYFGEAMLAEECEVIGNIHDNKLEDIK